MVKLNKRTVAFGECLVSGDSDLVAVEPQKDEQHDWCSNNVTDEKDVADILPALVTARMAVNRTCTCDSPVLSVVATIQHTKYCSCDLGVAQQHDSKQCADVIVIVCRPGL